MRPAKPGIAVHPASALSLNNVTARRTKIDWKVREQELVDLRNWHTLKAISKMLTNGAGPAGRLTGAANACK